jgi:hypothetical protein
MPFNIRPLHLRPESGQKEFITLKSPELRISLTTSLVACFVSLDSDISLKKKSNDLGFW